MTRQTQSLLGARRTTLGLYLSAREAAHFLDTHEPEPLLIDVRTPGEYVYVGHPPLAINIPWLLQLDRWDDVNQCQQMELNPVFVEAVEDRASRDTTLLLLCRSGIRSAASANRLAEAGFTMCYNVTDGFEGDPLDDPEHPQYGQRVVDGWKNSGLLWTTSLIPGQFWTGQ